MFQSRLPMPEKPNCDVFTHIFHKARKAYSPQKIMYRIDGGNETLTLAELEDQSRSFADAIFTRYNITTNTVVGIVARDKIQYPVAFFGSIAAGATVAPVPIQGGMSVEDVASRLLQSDCKLVVTDSSLLGFVESASNLAGCIPIITLDRASDDTPCVEDLVKSGDSGVHRFGIVTYEAACRHNAFINRTSGSTGVMKSVLTSTAHYIASLEGTVRTVPDNTDPEHDVWLSSLSLGFFINAKLNMSLNILLGIPTVFMQQPLDETNTDVIKRHNISFLFVTPPVVGKIAKSSLKPEDVKSVKWLLSAGASIHDNLRAALAEKFTGVPLTLEWGTSETMLIAIQTDEKSRLPGSSGTLINGMEARVVSMRTGRELGPLEQGEIWVRNSLAPFKGYKDNEIANRDFDLNGFFHTGDFGFLDEDCNVYIIDRLKELLRVGDGYGSRVSATELENVVFEHPAVKSVIVVGIHSEVTHTDHPTAFVVVKPEYESRISRALSEEIEGYADARLTGLKRITGGVHFLTEYPTTGFKIDRKRLKTLVDVDRKIEMVSPREMREASNRSPHEQDCLASCWVASTVQTCEEER